MVFSSSVADDEQVRDGKHTSNESSVMVRVQANVSDSDKFSRVRTPYRRCRCRCRVQEVCLVTLVLS